MRGSITWFLWESGGAPNRSELPHLRHSLTEVSMRVIGVAFAVSLVFAPFVAAGQPAGHRLPRIGYLSGGSDSPRDAAFRQGLRELGYIEGRTSPSSTGSQRER